jgi:Pyruvate/2-oxoacid:ferredoxin oxidoreductase delta subunit
MCIEHNNLKLTNDTSLIVKFKRCIEAYAYKLLLRFYLTGASVTKLPGVGSILKKWLIWYANTQHAGKIISKEEAYKWIENTGNVVVSICYCRDTFKRCSMPVHSCIRISDISIFQSAHKNDTKVISISQAKEIINYAEANGLFHLIAWCDYPNVYSICNCCLCCCIAYQIWHGYGIVSALQKGNMIAHKEDNSCDSCGRCITQCRFNALTKSNNEVILNQDYCMGCGLCRNACNNNALRLVSRE